MGWNQYSASSGARARFCVFPETDAAPSRPKSEMTLETVIANAFHSVFARVVNSGLGTGPAHELIDRELFAQGLQPDKHRLALTCMRPIEQAFDFVRVHPVCQAETAIAYDVKTKRARVLGVDLGRNYVLGPDECGGTVDAGWFESLDGIGDVRRAGIRDHKCGPMAKDHTEPVCVNTQLRQLAHWTMLANPGVESVLTELSIVGSDGFQTLTVCEQDALTLSDMDDFLLDIHDRILAGEKPRPGIHCTEHFCPILSVCPAHQESITKISSQSDALSTPNTSINFTSVEDLATPEQAAKALAIYKAVERICEIKIRIIKQYVDRFGALDVGDGKVFRRAEKENREIISRSVSQLVELLSKYFPEDAVRTVVHATVQQSQLDHLSKTYAPARGIGKLKRAANEELDKAGVVARTMKVEYKVVRAKGDPEEGEGG